MMPPLDPLRFHGGRWPLLALRRGWKALIVLSVLTGLTWAFWSSSDLPHRAEAGELSRYGLRTVAVFIAAVLLWVTEAVPLVVTGISVFTALVLCGFDLDQAAATQFGLVRFTPQLVASWFGDRVVYFLLGVFLIAGSLSASHVVDHLALRLLNLLGTSARRLRQGVFWTAFFAAWLMSEHAVAAMLFPVVARIRDALGKPRGSSTYVSGLFIAMAWGVTIGGIVTYLGGARIALAMGIAAARGVSDIPSFTGLMLHSLPIAIPFALAAALLIEFAYPIDVDSVSAARHALAERRRELGRFGPRQQAVSLILVLTIAAWAWFGVSYLAPVALASAALLLGTGLVRWTAVQAHVPWDLLLMEAGALALCQALETTGAAAWGAHQAFAALGDATPLVVITLVTLATILLTELFSNPAVVTLLIPLLVTAAAPLGVSPIHLVLAVALPCGLSFVLPLGSPPLAIAFASGELTMRRIASWGLLLDLIAVPLVAAVYWLVWRGL